MRQILLTVLVAAIMASSGLTLVVGAGGSEGAVIAEGNAIQPAPSAVGVGERPAAEAATASTLPIWFEEVDGGLLVRNAVAPMRLDPNGIHMATPDGDVGILFDGGAPRVPHGEDRLEHFSNYLMGSDSAGWRLRVPHFAQGVYEDVWPGIDVVFYVSPDGTLEFDLRVAPGADPSAARFMVDGASPVLDEGRLRLDTDSGSTWMEAPVSFQGSEPVGSHFVVDGAAFRIAVGPYDQARELTVDPKVAYSTYYGDSYIAQVYGAGTDAYNDFYLGGLVYDSGSSSPHFNNYYNKGGGYDGFIAKFDGSSYQLEWATYFGGSSTDYVRGLAVGDDIVAAVVETYSTDFPNTDAPQSAKTAASGTEVAVVALSLDGQSELYSGVWGSGYYDYPKSIAVKGDKVYVGGYSYYYTSYPTTYPTTSNAFMTTSPSTSTQYDWFATVIDTTLTGAPSFVYSTLLGTTGYDAGAYGISAAADGTFAIVGDSTMLPTKGGGPTGTPHKATASATDAYVAKFDPGQSGANSLQWATYVGGSSTDYGHDVMIAPDGSVYVSGSSYYMSTQMFPTGMPLHRPMPGSGYYYGFVAKLSADGERLDAGTYYPSAQCKTGGTCTYGVGSSTYAYEGVNNLAMGADGEVLIQGIHWNAETLDGGRPARSQPWVDKSYQDYYLAALAPDLSKTIWYNSVGGSSYDYYFYGYYAPSKMYADIASFPDGRALLAGNTQSGDFPTTPNGYQGESGSSSPYGIVQVFDNLPAIPVITGAWEYAGQDWLLQSERTSDGSIYGFLQDGPAPSGVAYTMTTITLDGSATQSGDDMADPLTDYTYTWDLDEDGVFDDATGIDGVAAYRGTERGPARYCMRVVDTMGEKSEACLQFEFVNRPPWGDIATVPDPPKLCQPIQFDATGLDDPDGLIVSYEWDFHRGKYGTDLYMVRPQDADGNWAAWSYVPIESTDIYRIAGTQQMAVTVVDDDGASSEIVRTFTIDNNRGRPLARPDAYTVLEGQSISVDVTAGVLQNDCHPYNLNWLNAQLWKKPVEGNLSKFENGGNFVYTAPLGFIGTDFFEYRLVDPQGMTSEAVTVRIEVIPRNAAPIAHDSFESVDEDPIGGHVFTLDVEDANDELDALGFELLGTLPQTIIGKGPELVYKPPKDFCTPTGPLVFSYRVRDPVGETDEATVTLDVKCMSDPPRPTDDYFAVAMDAAPEILDVVWNDHDPDAQYDATESFQVTGVLDDASGAEPQAVAATLRGGVAEAMPDGTVRYTPPPGWAGLDQFWYWVEDKGGDGRAGTVTVDVFDVANNGAPVAIDQAGLEAFEDTLTRLTLKATDPEDPVQVLSFSVESPTLLGGTASVVGGEVHYMPPQDACDVTDALSFAVYDPAYRAGKSSNTDAGVVHVDVLCVNDAPLAVDDVFSIGEDMPTMLDVLANDGDVDSGAGSLRVVGLGVPTHGTASYAQDGIWYRPGQDVVQPATFSYLVRDPQGLVSQATVTVQVAPSNDAPYTNDEPFVVLEDTLPYVELDVLRHAVDPEGDAFALASIGQPVQGSIVVLEQDPVQVVRFTPAPNATDTVKVPYTVVDALGASRAGVLVIEIEGVNDAPRAIDDPAGGLYIVRAPGQAVVPAGQGLLVNDLDNEDAAMSLIPYLVEAPQNGVVKVLLDGSFQYTPEDGFRGRDSFRYAVKDLEGANSLPALVVLEVVWPRSDSPTGDAPVRDEGVLAVPEVRADWQFVEGEAVELSALLRLGPTGSALWSQTDGVAVPFEQSMDGRMWFTAPIVPAGVSGLTLRFEVVGLEDGFISAPQQVVVRIVDGNDRPVVDAGEGVETVSGREVVLEATGVDRDGDVVSFAWSQVSGPVVALADMDAAVLRFTAPEVPPGEVVSLWFSVTGSDALEASKPDSVRVVVRGPEPLRLPGGFGVRPEGGGLLFEAASVDGQEYAWDFGDGGVAAGATALHRFAAAGQYEVVLTVRNVDGLEAEVRRQVIVDQDPDGVAQVYDVPAAEAAPAYLPVLVGVLVVVALLVFALGVARYVRGRGRRASFKIDR